MEMKYTTSQSRLGTLVVAATPRGICSVSLRESEDGVEESLRKQFPSARLERDDAGLKPDLNLVLDRLEGRSLDAPLPLDLQGTAFQREVWSELLAIPPGSTSTYGSIARAINRPKATRAVAQACGANPVAIVVPCHRVVMSDGTIGGYSGLPGVKQALLNAEGVKQFQVKAD